MTYRLGEFHQFSADGRVYLYLTESAGIFEIDGAAQRTLEALRNGERTREALIAASGLDTFEELAGCRAIVSGKAAYSGVQDPPAGFPLQTLVLNLTNQCNLSCHYCYEYGADKIATPQGKPKFMNLETAKAAVDLLLAQAHGRTPVQITFFGGETLMNFPLLQGVVAYADEQLANRSGSVSYSLTTNGTLLTPPIIDFLAEHRIGVTVSMDGPRELHDQLRVFANGKGSYDVIEPKVRELIRRHTTRPITARVTLTSGVNDVLRIFRHLKHDLGFHEVGFAPATASKDQLYTIGARGMDGVLEQFHQLADEYLECAIRGELHGFSNVSETLSELQDRKSVV